MSWRYAVTVSVLGITGSAWAGETKLDIALGGLVDPPSAESLESSKCGSGDFTGCEDGIGKHLGARLAAPVKVGLTDTSWLRVGPVFEFGGRSGGLDVTCQEGAVGVVACGDSEEGVRTGIAEGHYAATLSGMLAVGPEFAIPVGESQIYVGGEVAVGVVYSMHSLGYQGDNNGSKTPTDGIFQYRDQGCFELDDEGAVESESGSCQDAWTLTPALGANVLVGWRSGGSVPLFVEAGYGATTIASSPVKPYSGALELNQRRDVWDPVRLSVGLQFSL